MIGILGGGLAGLTLGSSLQDCEILEKENEVGGLCRSITSQGFTFDPHGSHVLFSRSKEALSFIEKVLGDNIVRRRRNSKIYYKGRYVKYPFENGLSDLPVKENLECLTGFLESYIARQIGGTKRPRNFKEWTYYKFGKGIAEKYLLPYNEKIWKIKPEEMGIEWAEGRVPDPPLEDIIKSSLGIETEGYLHQLHFLYPKFGGIHSLSKAIERNCKRIKRNFEVRKIRKKGKNFLVSNGNEEKRYERIISTIPLPELVTSLVDVPREVLDRARNLKHNSLITVMLGIDSPKVNDLSWVYFPQRDFLFHRVSFPSNFSEEVSPNGKSTVMAEITCKFGDDVWASEDNKLISHVINKLHECKIIDKKEVVFSSAARTKYAYILYDLSYAKNIAIVKDFLGRKGIYLCGRLGEFEYLNMDTCILRALSLAKKLREENENLCHSSNLQ